NRGEAIAGIAASEAESQDAIDAALAAGLVWREGLSRRSNRGERLMVFVSKKSSTTIAARMAALKKRHNISIFEFSVADQSLEQIAAFNQGDLIDRLRSASRPSSWPREKDLDPAARVLINSVTLMVPDEIEHHRKGSRVIFSIRGLEFARLSINRKRVDFGLDDNRVRLDKTTRGRLAGLIDRILSRRSPESSRRGDQLFRAQAERWLEAIVMRDVTSIDPTMDPRHVYSQVPAYRGDQRSYIDLLTVS